MRRMTNINIGRPEMGGSHNVRTYGRGMSNTGDPNGVRKSPKRGAFPTPKSEIEAATPYTPEDDQAPDQPDTSSSSPANTDQQDG